MATGGQMSTASGTLSWYKWLILVSACTTQFLRSAFLYGTIPVLSIYYEENFGDRKLSSMIGSTQAAFAYGASIPAIFVCRKIGAGKVQIAGGVLCCLGLTCTAFTTAAWQALLINGVVTGIGGACVYAGGYSAVASHFVGLAPFVAMSTSVSLGALTTPLIIKTMINWIGFKNCLITCGGIMSLNLLLGAMYREPHTEAAIVEKRSNARQISLKIKEGRRGIFQTRQGNMIQDDLTRQPDTEVKEAGEELETNAANQEITQEGQSTPICLKSLLAKAVEYKMAMNYLLADFFAYAGHVSFLGNIGDYATHALSLSDNVYATAITVMGVSRLVTGLVYILVTKYFLLSSLCMYAVTATLQAAVIFTLISKPSELTVYVLLGLFGAFQALFSCCMYGCCAEVTSTGQASYMFMVQSLGDGCASLVAPIITAYLQVEIDIDAGLYFSGAIMCLSSVLLLPSAINTLRLTKVYQAEDLGDNNLPHQTSYKNLPL